MKFCNHCGRLYDDRDGGKCSCRREKREYRHIKFYDTPGWRALSRFIKTRDYLHDRLAMYFMKYEPANDVEKKLRDYLINAQGQARQMGGVLIVHHIIEREKEPGRAYDQENLITLEYHTHEYVHQLYNTNKTTVQDLLFKAVRAELP